MLKKQRITISDVAGQSGVSKVTISRYLNGKYEYMSEETRERIARVIRESGYRPNRIAKSLKTDRSGLIGLVLADAGATLTPFVVSGVCDTCSKHGWNVIVINSNNDPRREIEQVENLVDQRIDGLIVSSGYNTAYYEKINQTELPVVLVDRAAPNAELDAVTINHRGATASVINDLIDKGFRRFVLFTREANPFSTLNIREEAVFEVCRKRLGGNEHCTKILLTNPGDSGAIKKHLEPYSRSAGDGKTALFVVDAMTMAKVVYSYYQLGMKVSDHFMIAGYDLWHLSQSISPRISTITQPLSEMAELAAKRLMEKIRAREPLSIRKEVLQCHCVYTDIQT